MARHALLLVGAMLSACAPAAPAPAFELPAPAVVVDVARTTSAPPPLLPSEATACPSEAHWDAKTRTCIVPLPSVLPVMTPHPDVLSDPCAHLEAPGEAFFDCDPAQGAPKK